MKSNKKSAKKFFQSAVEDYKKEFYESGYRSFMSVRLDRFMNEIDSLTSGSGKNALDAGCGPGYMTKALLDRKYKTTAFDASPEMLRLTRELVSVSANNDYLAELVEGDIENMPFSSDQFDLIASAGVIEYLQNDIKVFAEFSRTLKSKGVLIVSSTNRYSPIGMFEPVIEAIKRNNMTRNMCNWVLAKIGGTQVRPRKFMVRKHSAKQLIESAENANFEVLKVGYFYGLPWPHPIDRVFPKFTDILGKKLEKYSESPLRFLFEGMYIVARKR